MANHAYVMTVGDRVLARWPQETEWWYPGVVVGVSGPEVEIQYDDGDRAMLHAELARPLQIRPGARVQCRYQGGGAFYWGQIVAVTGSAIQVNYDDGDREVSSVSMIRVNSQDL